MYARDVDQRSMIYEKALEVGKEYERKTKVSGKKKRTKIIFIIELLSL